MSGYLGDLAAMIVRRQRLAQLLHACGPRPVYELLAELEAEHPGLMVDFEAAATRYVSLPPCTYRALGAHDFNHGARECQR